MCLYIAYVNDKIMETVNRMVLSRVTGVGGDQLQRGGRKEISLVMRQLYFLIVVVTA